MKKPDPLADDSQGKQPKRRPGRPPVPGPTARQREVLAFIRTAIQTDRRPPSIDEIRRHFHFKSTFAVRTHLDALEKKGLLLIARNSHRGLSLPEDEADVSGTAGQDPRGARLVPLLGDAPAGRPSEALEQADEQFALDPGLFPHPEIFAIRVRGDSMLGAGIFDHDLALIRPGGEAADGALVLARVNGEVTLKRLRLAAGRPYLHPENPEYEDIVPGEGDEFAIVGTVTGIIRKY